MRIFISGGCKNGKSTLARRLAVEQNRGGGLYYVATMTPTGEDDLKRIARHREERADDGFTTLEQPRDIAEILKICDTSASILLDSLTALLHGEMFRGDEIDYGAAERIVPQLTRVIDNYDNIVVVSDYIYSDAEQYGGITERYRAMLARLDRAAARHCDTVLEVAYSEVIKHKGD